MKLTPLTYCFSIWGELFQNYKFSWNRRHVFMYNKQHPRSLLSRLMDHICTRHPWSSDLGLITKIMQDFFGKVVNFTKNYSPELKDCLFVYFNAMFAEILVRPMESSLVNHGIHNILELFGWWPFTTRNMLPGFVSVSVPFRTW